MSTAVPAADRDVEVFRHQAGMIRAVVGMNTEGITHEESLIQPQQHGNSLNWVLGHLTCIYNNSLPLLGQQPVVDAARLAHYDRGSAPLDPSKALGLQELTAAWNQAADRVDAGLAELSGDVLDGPAPFSPTDNPDETVRSLVNTVLFHQAYHAGQLGLLRRIAGKPGAIR
jgi:hypothetical protein